jgi:hypothetical protein
MRLRVALIVAMMYVYTPNFRYALLIFQPLVRNRDVQSPFRLFRMAKRKLRSQ